MLSLVLSMLAFSTAIPPMALPAVDAPVHHVRSSSREVRALLRDGSVRSPTFAALVAALDAADVIVYVEDVRALPRALEGRLQLLPRQGGQRYVRIEIALQGGPDERIALVGHELQHAVEVAGAADVIDAGGMSRLYDRIGTRGAPHLFDTLAAQAAGRQVSRELRER